MSGRGVLGLSGPLRRIRVSAGPLGLLAALGLVAALLATGAPRLANGYGDQGLGQDVSRLPYLTRDLIFTRTPPPDEPVDPATAADQLSAIRNRLAAPLPGLVGREWFAGQIGPEDLIAAGDSPALTGGCRASLPLRAQPGLDRVATVVAGRWPASRGSTVEAVISQEAADVLKLGVESQVTLTGRGFFTASVPVRIVGIYQPVDPAAPDWDGIRLVDIPCSDPGAGMTWQAPLLTDLPGLERSARTLSNLTYTWRYRIDERRLSTAEIPDLLAAIGQARRPMTDDPPRLTTGLDAMLSTFDAQLRSVQALLAVVQAGFLTTVLGLIVLAARLVVERRRQELALLRARGASVATVGGWTLREAVLVLPAATLAGWLLGRLVPGRPGDAELPLVVALLVGTTLAVPLLAMLGQRRAHLVGQRRDLVRHRPSPRRLTAEAVVLLVAVLGVVLVRQRGLDQSVGVDPYLASVPVLLAAAAALIALRIVPWPLRQVSRLAARSRAAVPFLGLARAGRAAPVTALPAALLVVAVATGVFASVVTSTVAAARDRVSDREVAADARLVSASYVTPETGDRIAALPGVTAVSAVAAEPGQQLNVRNPDGSGWSAPGSGPGAGDGRPVPGPGAGTQRDRHPAAGRVHPAGPDRRSGAGRGLPRRRRGARPGNLPDRGAGPPVRLHRGHRHADVPGTDGRRTPLRRPALAGPAGAGLPAGPAQPVPRRRGGPVDRRPGRGGRRRTAGVPGEGARQTDRGGAGPAGHGHDLAGAPADAGAQRGEPVADLHLPHGCGRRGRPGAAHGRVRRAGRGAAAGPGALPAAHHGASAGGRAAPCSATNWCRWSGSRCWPAGWSGWRLPRLLKPALGLSGFTGGLPAPVQPRPAPGRRGAAARGGGTGRGAVRGEVWSIGGCVSARCSGWERRTDVGSDGRRRTRSRPPGTAGDRAGGGPGRRGGPAARDTSSARAWSGSSRPTASRWSPSRAWTWWSIAASCSPSSAPPAPASRRC